MQTATRLPRRVTTALPLLAAVLAAMPVQTHAANGTWTGDGLQGDGFTPDTLWSNTGNWTASPVPGATDTATFGPAANVAVNNTGVTVNELNFAAGAPAYTFSTGFTMPAGGNISIASGAALQTLNVTATPGGTLTFNNNSSLSNGLALTLTANGPTVAPGTTTVTFDGSGTTTLAGTAIASVANTSTPTSLTSIVKNGTGTLIVSSVSHTNIWGGFVLNSGTLVGTNNNSFSNRGLTLNGGTLQNNLANAATFNSGNALINVTGNTTIFYNATSGNWGIGPTGGVIAAAPNTAVFKSSGSPVVTFTDAAPNINGIRIGAKTDAFSGTYKLGLNGALTFNGAARGSATSTLDMGTSGNGSHYFASGVTLHDTSTQTITPIKFGALTGSDPAAVMGGRQGVVSGGTYGTQFEIGGLNTNTTYGGAIRDGSSASNLLLVTNGTADGTAQTATATLGSSTYSRANGAAGVQGTTELIKVGSGTLTLTGTTNTHTGGTVVKGGVLAVSSDASLGATYDGSLRPFQFTHKTDTAGTVTGAVYSATDYPDLVLSGGNPTTAANIGVYGVTLNATWNNNNIFTSFSNQSNDTTPTATAIVNNMAGLGYTSIPTVTVSGGTITSGTTLPVIAVRVKGLLTLDGGTLQTDAGITSNRAVVVGAAGGTIDTNGFDSTFSGVINGSGDLTKTGNGTLTLTGNNTLTGLTTVAGGVLNLEGTLAGSVTVNAGASLAGNGTAGSATILGTIAPGNSIGQLDFGGATSLSGTAMIELDAAGAPNADLINVAGAVTLGGDLTVSWLSAPAPGTYNIIDATSFSGSFANVNLPALTGSLTWDTSQLNTAGILTVVPEPGSALLALLSGSLLLRRRRR